MIEYGKFIAITCLCFALLSFVTYKLSDKGVRVGLAVVFLGAALSPLFAFIGDGGEDLLEIPRVEGSAVFEETVRDSYEEGISRGVAELLSCESDLVICRVHDFDFKQISAKRVTVTLVGIAVLSDTGKLEDFFAELGFEHWEVLYSLDGN